MIFQLVFVGSIFEDLEALDLVVDLSNNSLSYLPGEMYNNLTKYPLKAKFQKLTSSLSSRRRGKASLTSVTTNSSVAVRFK